MFEIKNLTYIYNNKTKAIDNISFKFEQKGLYYIVGESGSGKSTLLNCLSNLLTDFQGEILYKEKSIKEFDKYEHEEYLRSQIGVTSQYDYFEDKLSVMDNLMICLNIFDLTKQEKQNRINYYASKLLLTNLLNKKVNKLSGGELKRMNILRTLIKQTDVLIFDEPIGNLDEDNRIRITKLFEELALDKLVIIVTHNIDNIKNYTKQITLKDGKIIKVNNGNLVVNKVNKSLPNKRKKVNVITNIYYCLKCLIKKGNYFSFSLFATSIALTSIGLIVLLTNCVSLCLDTMLKTSFTNNTMLIKQKENTSSMSYYKSGNEASLNYLNRNYNDYIINISYYYDINFENVFQNGNSAYFIKDNLKMESKLSSRDFNEFVYYKEVEELSEYNYVLENDELILGLNLETIYSLTNFLNLKEPTSTNLNKYLANHSLVLLLKLSNNEWGYNFETLFNIKYFITTNKNKIIHTNKYFSKYFVEEMLQFKTYDDLSYQKEVPWCYFKVPYVSLKNELKEDFFINVEEDKNCNNLIFEKVNKTKMPKYYGIDEKFLKSRYFIYLDYQNGIKVSDINKMFKNYNQYIDYILYSDSIYYCSDEGTLSGFLKPVYVSNKKELLNKISDYNYQSDFDLQGFQGTSITYDKGVIMGDLSNINDNPLSFKSYIEKMDLKLGRMPSSYKEILISSNLAKELFINESLALDKKLYISMLTEIVYKNDGYKNIFKDGELIISGIVEEEKNLIYQKPRFIHIIGQEMFDIKLSESNIDKVVVNFKQGLDISNLLNDLKKNNKNYDFSLPCLQIQLEVKKIVNYLAIFLYSFGAFSLLIASSLLIVIIILFIKEDKDKIFLLKLMGYSNKDIVDYYYVFSYLIGFLSYVFSMFSIYFCSVVFENQLHDLLGDINYEIYLQKIYLINFFLIFIICSLTCLVVKKSLSSKNKKKSKNLLINIFKKQD